jgi:hypothetical protein
MLLLMQQPEDGLLRIEKALKHDRSEAFDALGLPPTDGLGFADSSAPEAQLTAACRTATETLEGHNSSSFAKNVALAALYARRQF